MELTDEQIELILLMNKRIGFSEFKSLSENDEQAYKMRDAFTDLVEEALK